MGAITDLFRFPGPSSSLALAAGLIVLMAQMGCYVPAEMAVIPVRDSLLSRIGTDDDMENNMSTFLMEMREVAQAGTTSFHFRGFTQACRYVDMLLQFWFS